MNENKIVIITELGVVLQEVQVTGNSCNFVRRVKLFVTGDLVRLSGVL